MDESGVEIAPVMDNAPMDRSNSQPLSAAGTQVSLPSTVVAPKRARSPPAQRVKSPPPSGFRSPLATKSSAAQNSVNPSALEKLHLLAAQIRGACIRIYLF